LPPINKTYHQLAGKLRVIRILPKGIATPSQFPCVPGTNNVINIAATGRRRLAFYYEAQCIAETLANQTARELVNVRRAHGRSHRKKIGTSSSFRFHFS
jgi:hypothetical protein